MSVKARFTFRKIPLEDWGLTEVNAVVLVIVQTGLSRWTEEKFRGKGQQALVIE